MKPVMMRSMTSSTEAYIAGLASILDMDPEKFPVYEGLAAPMQWDAWLAVELNLCCLRFQAGALSPPPGYWLARIESPYTVYDVHTVVMAGPAVAHDPHPEPQDYSALELLAVTELLVPMDPAQPSGAYS